MVLLSFYQVCVFLSAYISSFHANTLDLSMFFVTPSTGCPNASSQVSCMVESPVGPWELLLGPRARVSDFFGAVWASSIYQSMSMSLSYRSRVLFAFCHKVTLTFLGVSRC